MTLLLSSPKATCNVTRKAMQEALRAAYLTSQMACGHDNGGEIR